MHDPFPRHRFDPATLRCERCLISEAELAEMVIPRSCMSDEDIAWTKRRVREFIVLRT